MAHRMAWAGQAEIGSETGQDEKVHLLNLVCAVKTDFIVEAHNFLVIQKHRTIFIFCGTD